MDGAEFLAYVKRKFKRTDKDTEIYEATTDIIADIRRQLNTEDYKEEAYTAGITTLGEYKLTLPTDFGDIIGCVTLVDDDSSFTQKLNKISKQSFDEKYGDRLHASVSDIDTSVPSDFCIYSGQILVGPVPDKITYKYYINYIIQDYVEVTSSTDPVPFATKNRKLLRAGVLKDLYDGLEQYEESSFWNNEYVDELRKLNQTDMDNIHDFENVTYSGI